MQAAAAIAHERSARGIGEQIAKRIDTVLQGHRRPSKKGGRDKYNPATISVPGRPGYPDEWLNKTEGGRRGIDRDQESPAGA
jgi:hypothetical protein